VLRTERILRETIPADLLRKLALKDPLNIDENAHPPSEEFE